MSGFIFSIIFCFKVVVADVNIEARIETVNEFAKRFGEDRVKFQKCNVALKEDIETLYQVATDLYGYVDIMINNAGIVDEGRMEKLLDINFRGVLNGIKIAMQHMSKNNGGKGGCIINTSSNAAIEPTHFHIPVYSAAKSGILQYTRAIAHDPKFKTSGVRVNNLMPVAVETPMSQLTEESQVTDFEYYQSKLGVRKALTTEDVSRVLLHVLMNEEYKNDSFSIRLDGVRRVVPTYEVLEYITFK